MVYSSKNIKDQNPMYKLDSKAKKIAKKGSQPLYPAENHDYKSAPHRSRPYSITKPKRGGIYRTYSAFSQHGDGEHGNKSESRALGDAGKRPSKGSIQAMKIQGEHLMPGQQQKVDGALKKHDEQSIDKEKAKQHP